MLIRGGATEAEGLFLDKRAEALEEDNVWICARAARSHVSAGRGH